LEKNWTYRKLAALTKLGRKTNVSYGVKGCFWLFLAFTQGECNSKVSAYDIQTISRSALSGYYTCVGYEGDTTLIIRYDSTKSIFSGVIELKGVNNGELVWCTVHLHIRYLHDSTFQVTAYVPENATTYNGRIMFSGDRISLLNDLAIFPCQRFVDTKEMEFVRCKGESPD
jgi:hypothetical protein